MEKKTENQLYFKAAYAFDHVKLAIETFETYLQAEDPSSTAEYYKARNFLRDGEQFYEETLKEAKKLLGPLPPYSSAVYEKWRTDFLSQHRIQVEGQELNAIKEELLVNSHLAGWLSPEDIDRLLAREYEAQKGGRRKLANIKIRIILDRLQELLGQANALKKRAMAKLQSGA